MKEIAHVTVAAAVLVVLAFFSMHFPAINKAFARWLAAEPQGIVVQCYSMPRGSK